MYNSRSSILYFANLNDTNSSISCYVQQSDMYGNLLYQTQESILLMVDPVPSPPIPVSLTAQVGIISGVLLTVIFLLLVCVLVTTLMCRRQKQARSSYCHNAAYQSDYIKPVWTTINSAKPNYSSDHLSSGSVSSYHARDTLTHSDHHARDTLTHSDTVDSVVTNASDVSFRQNFTPASSKHTRSEYQRITQGRLASSIHETHFGDGQNELPVTLLHPPGLFLHPQMLDSARSRARSVAHIEQTSQRKVSSTKSEGFPCCSSYHASLSRYRPCR